MTSADELLPVLRTFALEAGDRMQAALDADGARDVEHKGRVDLVTRVDKEVQAFLVDAIGTRFPGEAVVGEEDDRDARPESAGPVWFVDPIDGTTNYVHGFPFYCVSIARYDAEGSASGVVFAPALDELFAASTGAGATLERPLRGAAPRSLRASACTRVDDALLATGFPYVRGATARMNLTVAGHALTRCRGIRRAGSAALDLCYVGAGRLDGYWEFALNPWDMAAGLLVAREAGARVTDFEGDDDVLWGNRICAAAPQLHDDLVRMIASAHATPSLDVLAPPFDGAVPLRGDLPGGSR